MSNLQNISGIGPAHARSTVATSTQAPSQMRMGLGDASSTQKDLTSFTGEHGSRYVGSSPQLATPAESSFKPGSSLTAQGLLPSLPTIKRRRSI